MPFNTRARDCRSIFPSQHTSPLQVAGWGEPGGAVTTLPAQDKSPRYTHQKPGLSRPLPSTAARPILQPRTSQACKAHADPLQPAGGRYWSAFRGKATPGDNGPCPAGSCSRAFWLLKGGCPCNKYWWIPQNNNNNNGFVALIFIITTTPAAEPARAAARPPQARRSPGAAAPRRLQGEPGGRASAAWGPGGGGGRAEEGGQNPSLTF